MSYYEWMYGRKSSVGRGGLTGARAAALVITGWLANSAIMQPAAAQISALDQPAFTSMDENHVDFLTFHLYLSVQDVSIGSKDNPLVHVSGSAANGTWAGTTNYPGDPYKQRFGDTLAPGGVSWPFRVTPQNCATSGRTPYVSVAWGTSSELFLGCSPFVPVGPSGSTLTYNSSDGTYVYTKGDGTAIYYSPNAVPGTVLATTVTFPDGRRLMYWYNVDGTGAPPLKSITRTDGLQLKYNYSKLANGDWVLSSVVAINNAYEYCAPTAATCTLSKTWPTATYSYGVPASGTGAVFTLTDSRGLVTRYTEDANFRTTSIKLPSSASADNITYSYCDIACQTSTYAPEMQYGMDTNNYVWSVTRDGHTWNYRNVPGTPTVTQCSNATYTSTNPLNATRQATVYNCLPGTTGEANAPRNPLISLTDRFGVTFVPTGQYGLIHTATKPEGNQTQYSWDARGNLNQETLVPKAGSPLAQIVLTANYDSTCANQFKCNKPNWVQDGLGKETDYTYDPTHGGVLTVTSPADSNGIRPQKTYTYTQRTAWTLNASGAYVASIPIWVLATETLCRTSAATAGGCTVAGDQVVKTYEYGPNSGPNNLFLRGVAVTADGATRRVCYGYDMYGNKISETTPRAGLSSCP